MPIASEVLVNPDHPIKKINVKVIAYEYNNTYLCFDTFY